MHPALRLPAQPHRRQGYDPLKDDYPCSNIVAIDYDPCATKINQENRIKLMLANAKALARQEAMKEPAGAGV